MAGALTCLCILEVYSVNATSHASTLLPFSCAESNTDTLVIIERVDCCACRFGICAVQQAHQPASDGGGQRFQVCGTVAHSQVHQLFHPQGYHIALSDMWGIETVPGAAGPLLVGYEAVPRRPCGALRVIQNTSAHSLAGREPSGAMITIRMQMGR